MSDGGRAVGVALGVGAVAGVVLLLVRSRQASAATLGSPRDRPSVPAPEVHRGPVVWGVGWVWPVPTLIPPWAPTTHYDATVSSGFGGPRGGGTRTHKGLDVMYRRRGADAATNAKFPPNVRQADGFASTKNYFLPPGTPCLAAKAGKVWSVQQRTDGGGWSVVLDHGKPWATYYTHLATTKLAPHTAQVVAAGEAIGTIGGNLADTERVRHLHFEAWYEGSGSDFSVDALAAGVMSTWGRERWQPAELSA